MSSEYASSSVTRSVVILGCSQRKKKTPHLIAAINRYDGPAFRVIRKHVQVAPETSPVTYILSARFGLISGNLPIPHYDHRLVDRDHAALERQVESQLMRVLNEGQPERLFVSVGRKYWSLLQGPLSREVAPESLWVATGGIGGRASQLAHWLQPKAALLPRLQPPGEATLLGTTIRLSRAEVLQLASVELMTAPSAAFRFETWYVVVGDERVAPKWLASVLFNKPVARFRTADARRVLNLLGVDCIYANHY
jgi:hypothetical protein